MPTSVVSASNPTVPDVDMGGVTDRGRAPGLLVEPGEVTAAGSVVRPDTALESVGDLLTPTGFDGGNSSCEMAIAISERKRARKKRLSIQGTGS